MKFKNKGSGAIYDTEKNLKIEFDGVITATMDTPDGLRIVVIYDTFSEFCEEWEDYEPIEPVFDEKIRKGIRAWWDMQDNPFKSACVLLDSKNRDRDGFYHWTIFGYIRNGETKISTDMEFRTKKLYDYNSSHDYTKEELCGEEEE